MKSHIFYALAILMLSACQTEPPFDRSTEEFILQPNFEIEMIAGEPLLDSPVAMTFDKKGRTWVVELPGYMRDIDGSEEDEPDGKIVILEDTNGDGAMDSRQILMDTLVKPRTLLHAYGGLLYNNGTSLWWAELDDTEVIRQVLVDSLYVVGGNIEHQPNGLIYNIDNWIYSANSPVRYRFKNGEWLREATSFRGQWGISADETGRLFYNNNSLPIAADYMMPNQLIQNPFQKVKFGYSQEIATSNQLFAYQATAVNRGYQDGVLDDDEKIKEFTSACGPLVYSGNLLGEEFAQNIFVCAPEANLVKRYILKEKDGLKSAIPAYDSTEFLISKDETFRPINLFNAPDGSLYVLDLRKGIIQHRAYMTSYLREKILAKGLEKVNGRGRIYRVTSNENKKATAQNLSNLNESELVQLLASPLLYQRNFAQQQLIFKNALDAKKAIKGIALDAKNPFGQLHAIWTLEGLDAFEESFWSKLSAAEQSPIIHELLVRFSTFFPQNEANQIAYFQKTSLLNHLAINRQLAVRLGKMNSPKAQELLLELANKHQNNPIICEAIISGIAGKEEELLTEFQPVSSHTDLSDFLEIVIKNKQSNKIQAPKLPTATFKDNRTAGFDLYNIYCASCHGMDGIGKENLAPPLLDSEYVGGSPDRLILLILNGLKGPVTVNGKRYEMNAVMPGIKNNPTLSDKDIADIVVFLRNSFSFSNPWISSELVTKWRAETKDREELFTEEELEKY